MCDVHNKSTNQKPVKKMTALPESSLTDKRQTKKLIIYYVLQ